METLRNIFNLGYDLTKLPPEAELILHQQCHEMVHPFCPHSCYKATWIVWKDAFLYGSTVYTPLFLFPALWRRKSLSHILQKTLPSILRSSTFLGSLGSMTLPMACFIRNMLGKNHPLQIFTAGLFTGIISISIEEKSRRPELAVYSLNQGMEAVYRMFAIRGFAPMYKYGDVGIFVVAMSILSYLYNHEGEHLGNVGGILSFITGTEKQSQHSSASHRSAHLCHNVNECLQHGLKTALRAFAIGYLARGTLSFVSNLFLQKMYKYPIKCLLQSFGLVPIRFGLFLFSFVAAWNGIPCLLRRLRNKQDSLNSIIAGAIAALAILLSRSTEMTMWFFSKALEGVFSALVSHGVLKSWKYGDSLLFTVCVGIIFYCSVLEPYNLRLSHFKFLYSASKGRYDQFQPVARAYHPEFFLKTGFKF